MALLVRMGEADGATIDLRYATADNLAGRPVYSRPVAMLHPRAAALLRDAARRAMVLGIMVASGWEPYVPKWWHYEAPECGGWPVLSAADVPEGPMSAGDEVGVGSDASGADG